MSLKEFRDTFGFIIHKHPFHPYDGGDASQRTFTDMLHRYSTEPNRRAENAAEIEALCKEIELPSGEYVRHPSGTRVELCD